MTNIPYAPLVLADGHGQLAINDNPAGGVVVELIKDGAQQRVELDFRALLDLRDRIKAIVDRQYPFRMNPRD